MSDVARRPRRRSHRVVWGAGAVLLLLAVVVGYLIWSGLSARSELKAAEKDAQTLQTALLDGDHAAADAALKRFATRTDAARARTSGPLWRVATSLPWVGDDFEAVRLVAWSASEVGRQAHAALFGDSERDLFVDLAPKDGRVDLGVVRELQPLMSRLDRSLSTSTARLRKVDTDGLSRFVKRSFVRFRDKLVEADGVAAGANRAVQVLPQMLGGDGPRTYLLRFENNAELRSTGGLPGSWVVVRADAGKVSIVEDKSQTGAFPEFPAPVVPLTPAEKEIWGVQLGTYFQDTNFTPDFPRSAEITRVMWEKRFPGQPIDGIGEIDAVSLAYILEATGPVKVTGSDVTLTAENAVTELLNTPYITLPTNEEQDEFFGNAAHDVFDAITEGASSPSMLLAALSRSLDEGRLRFHSFHEADQSQIAGTAIAAEMSFDADAAPELGIYLNDSTASKLAYYLSDKTTTQAIGCTDGRARYRTTAAFSLADFDPATVGEFVTGSGEFGIGGGQLLTSITVYGPVGGEISKLAFDGEADESEQGTFDDRGRPVLMTAMFINPGQTVEVSWETTVGSQHTQPLHQTMTPGLTTRDLPDVRPTGC